MNIKDIGRKIKNSDKSIGFVIIKVRRIDGTTTEYDSYYDTETQELVK